MYLDRPPNNYPIKCQYWQMLVCHIDLNWYTIGILLVNVFRNSNNLPLLVLVFFKFTNNYPVKYLCWHTFIYIVGITLVYYR